ncbi:MAG TPA: CHAD domain-containing protein [Capillimicrobium sp.]|jgi:CHAD domain-containing protein
MAYRLNLHESPGAALRDVAAQQLDSALAELRGETGATPDKAVHQARKSLKKTRALLRLARPALGNKAYARENAALRDAARLLSGTRDADVLRATTAALAERYVGHVPAATFEALETAFAAQVVAERATADGSAPAAEAAAMIVAARERLPSWPLDAARPKDLIAALRRTYARGQAQLAAVDAQPSVEAIHDWRKRVKDLWYQQRLLHDAWPCVLSAQAEEAGKLGEMLGDDHDLAVLVERLRDPALPVAADLGPVVDAAEARRAELLDEALRLGARLYAEPPKAFTARTRAYLDLALQESADAGAAR